MSLLDKIRGITNRIVDSYLEPLFVDWSVKEVIKNYRKNQDEALLKASEEEGTQFYRFNERRFNKINKKFVKEIREDWKKYLENKNTLSLEEMMRFYDEHEKLRVRIPPEKLAEYSKWMDKKLVPITFISKMYSESIKDPLEALQAPTRRV